jgi:hypothetical protein
MFTLEEIQQWLNVKNTTVFLSGNPGCVNCIIDDGNEDVSGELEPEAEAFLLSLAKHFPMFELEDDLKLYEKESGNYTTIHYNLTTDELRPLYRQEKVTNMAITDEIQKAIIAHVEGLDGVKDLSAEEKQIAVQKILTNPNINAVYEAVLKQVKEQTTTITT